MTDGTAQAPAPAGDDVLVVSRWYHDGVPIARIRAGDDTDGAVAAGEDAILAVVAAWLRRGRR